MIQHKTMFLSTRRKYASTRRKRTEKYRASEFGQE